MTNTTKIFSLDCGREYAERVAAHLGVDVAAHEEREFEDGEHKCRTLDPVRGEEVFVVQSLHGEPGQSVNDKLCRVLFFVGALRDAGAARVNVIAPYLSYARKDQKTKPNDPITTRYLAAMFEAVGADALMTLDVHNLAAFQNAFRIRTEHIEAMPLFVSHFAHLLEFEMSLVVASPDIGGVKRAERFRQLLETRLQRPIGSALVEKYRSSGEVTGFHLVGDVDDKNVILLDDLVSSGTTMARAIDACAKHGAKRVYAAATHGLFTHDPAFFLHHPLLDRLVVTDTVTRPGAGHELEGKLVVLDSTALVADVMTGWSGGKPLMGDTAR